MSSFTEPTAMKHAGQSSIKFMHYNKVQLSRIYPAGRRVDSSNYDPVMMWNCGCQIGTYKCMFILWTQAIQMVLRAYQQFTEKHMHTHTHTHSGPELPDSW